MNIHLTLLYALSISSFMNIVFWVVGLAHFISPPYLFLINCVCLAVTVHIRICFDLRALAKIL